MGQVGRRRDFFNAVNRKTNLQLTTTTDIAEERRREQRGEVEVCRGFPAESEKGTPLGSAGGATLTGVKRSPFSADYFARGERGALLLLPPFSTFQRQEECSLPPRPLFQTVNSTPHARIHGKTSRGNNIIVAVPGESKIRVRPGLHQEIQQVHRSIIGFSCGIMDGLLKKRRRKVMSRK